MHHFSDQNGSLARTGISFLRKVAKENEYWVNIVNIDKILRILRILRIVSEF